MVVLRVITSSGRSRSAGCAAAFVVRSRCLLEHLRAERLPCGHVHDQDAVGLELAAHYGVWRDAVALLGGWDLSLFVKERDAISTTIRQYLVFSARK